MHTKHDILIGDCRETLQTLPAESAHVCVTSPPYWGLRDYQTGSTAEIGSEPTLDDHLTNIVDVYREVRRVLRPDALSFLNYGDAFSGSGATGGEGKQRSNSGSKTKPDKRQGVDGFKQKDLMCLPHRVAIALQADGWYLRQCIIWCKGSPMPESVRGSRWERCRVKVKEGVYNGRRDPARTDCEFASNLHHQQRTEWQPCPGCDKCRDTDGYVYRQSAGRPTTAHEFVFLLSKSPSYYYAMDENRVSIARGDEVWPAGGRDKTKNANGDRQDWVRPIVQNPAGRNLWSYWTDISPSAFKDSHFATMPLDLARRCIKLGTSSVGVCSACGAPWAPVVELERIDNPGHKWGGRGDSKVNPASRTGSCFDTSEATKSTVVAHRPTCTCNADKSPAVVLDPFGGAGTTAIAARELGHSSVICELNESYAAMARKRMRSHFAAGDVRQPASSPGQKGLFDA